MKRKHLFEIEDQTWCPSLLRETTTDFLVAIYKVLHIFDPAYQKIFEIITITKVNAIVDCCSGSGGPTKQLREYLDSKNLQSIPITLTDKYPNSRLFEQLEKQYGDRLKGYKDPVDARDLPKSLKGLRIFFSSFHHFRPEHAVQILQNAVNNNEPIAIFETTKRTPAHFIKAIFSPLLMFFIMPFARRLNWQKFLVTYLIPIAPFTFMWDYIISNLRTYSEKELKILIAQLNAPHFKWEIGQLWSKKAQNNIGYLVGYPSEGNINCIEG